MCVAEGLFTLLVAFYSLSAEFLTSFYEIHSPLSFLHLMVREHLLLDYKISLAPGGFFLAFAATLQPFYNAAGAYSSTGTNTMEGQESPVYAASFGKKSLRRFIHLASH
jgi:hypothetical protein